MTESEQTAASKRQGAPTDGVSPAKPEGEYVRTPFSDEDQIADWAAEAVHRMADSGILQGRSDARYVDTAIFSPGPRRPRPRKE